MPQVNLTVFARIFKNAASTFANDLNSPDKSITVFLPTDTAFHQLRQDQIDALMNDEICSRLFLKEYIVNDEICPVQIGKYSAEYYSNFQRATFIALKDNFNDSTDHVYFNSQQVFTQDVAYSGSNGIAYYLNTVKISSKVVFLYDMFLYLKSDANHEFYDQLETDWKDALINNCLNKTLILPIQVSSEESYQDLTLRKSVPEKIPQKIDIRDFLMRGQINHYQLSDGQILKSVNNDSYLINTKSLRLKTPPFLKWVPMRSFQMKSINCQILEQNDYRSKLIKCAQVKT